MWGDRPSVLSPGCRRRTRSAYVHCRSGSKTPSYLHKPIEKRTSLGELRVLPRQDLRLRPVDVEDLRLSGFQRREVLVEIPLLDFALFVPVAFQVLAKLREPVPREADGEHSTNNRTSSLPDRLSRSFLDVAVSDVAILDLGHDRAPRGHILADLVGGAADMFPHVSVGSLQVIAPRRQTAFERHDPVANVDFSVRHGASLWLQSSVYWDRNARILGCSLIGRSELGRYCSQPNIRSRPVAKCSVNEPDPRELELRRSWS